MSNPQGQGQGQEPGQERQSGESEQDYRERLRRTGAQGTEGQDTGDAGAPQKR